MSQYQYNQKRIHHNILLYYLTLNLIALTLSRKFSLCCHFLK